MRKSPFNFFGFITKYKAWFILIIVLIVGIYVTKAVITYQGSFYTCTVTFSNISSGEIYSVQGRSDYSEKRTLVQKLTTSPARVRLKKNNSYEIQYTGSTGYESNTVQVTNASIVISPEYSSDTLQKMFAADEQTINQTINSIDPATIPSLYKVNNGTYYDHAKWYIATLKTTETPPQYYDTFLVVLERENKSWKVVVRPTLIASYSSYPSIPKQVLDYANKYRQTSAFDEIYQRTVTE